MIRVNGEALEGVENVNMMSLAMRLRQVEAMPGASTVTR